MAGYERGLENVINGLRSLSERNKTELMEAGMLVGSMMLEATRENANLTDHSQEDLDSLGHPYSTRMGKDSGPHPDNQVHIQTGQLYESIEQDIIVTSSMIQISIGVDESKVPYISDLIDGTSVMRPRDFLTKTLHEQKSNIYATVMGVIPKG